MSRINPTDNELSFSNFDTHEHKDSTFFSVGFNAYALFQRWKFSSQIGLLSAVIKNRWLGSYQCHMIYTKKDAYGIPEYVTIIKLKTFFDRTSPSSIKPGDEVKFPTGSGTKVIVDFIDVHHRMCFVSCRPKIFYSLYQSAFQVFQNKKISVILDEVFKPLKISVNVKSPIHDPEMELMIRYNETLMNFLNRCCFLMGCHWICEDNNIEIAPYKSLVPGKSFNERQHLLIIYHRTNRIKDTGGRMMSYDSNNPTGDLNAKTESPFHYAEWFLKDYTKPEVAQKLLDYASIFEAETIAFTSKIVIDIFSCIFIGGTKYYVTKCEFILSKETHPDDFDPEKFFFYIEAKTSVRYRSFEEPIAKSQQATVVLPKSGDFNKIIFKDEKSRVMVNFHFDEKKLQVPVPVAQSLASNSEGAFFLPKKGTEVVVEFLNGNPNFPFINGCLYNKENANKFKVHEAGWELVSLGEKPNIERKNIIKMSLEDKNEKMQLVSPKNIEITSNQGNISIQLQAQEKTEGCMFIKLTNGNFNIEIDKGDKKIIVSKGEMKIDVSGDLTIDASSIKLNAKQDINLKATSVKINSTSINLSGITKIEGAQTQIKSAQTMIQGGMTNVTSGAINLSGGSINANGGSISFSGGSIMINGMTTATGNVFLLGSTIATSIHGVGLLVPG
jgi:hypothetical protein